MNKVFLSGQVSNLPYAWVQVRFNAAARQFSNCKVVNPTKLCKPEWSWIRCMVVCLWNLLFCDTIAMLPGWHLSRGARIEHGLATRLRKTIVYLQ